MLTRWSDFSRSNGSVDELRRHLDRLFDDFEGWPAARAGRAQGPERIAIFDKGASLVLRADVPGLSEKDVTVTLTPETLSIAAERAAQPPEGYAVHRREREEFSLVETFSLPCRVDAERTTATIKDGVLTLTLTKAADAQPRQIAVRAQ
jgi:HSP20 family protein